MEKQKMTIHRALSELKMIDARIKKSTNLIEPVGLIQLGKPVNNIYLKEDFEKDVISKYQSVTDLIKRKMAIKSAIVMVNSVTMVTVGDKTMSIADAISFKSVIDLKQDLINTILSKYNIVKGRFNTENEKVKNVALENAKIMIGKQGDDRVKATDEDVKNIVDPFIKRNELHLVDPLNVEKLAEKLQTEIDEFKSEVDAVLSEINATTFIEI